MMAALEPVSGESRLGLCPKKRRGGVALCNTLGRPLGRDSNGQYI
jgi:hypothetical protein